MDHLLWMRAALKEAQKAFHCDEVPVGAIAVFQNQIIAREHNRMEELQDATAHAEMLCLRTAARVLGYWRLCDVVLYSTLEPCSMCTGALLLARIPQVVFGTRDHRHGACGSWVDLVTLPHPTHRLEVSGGVLEQESAKLMIEFFKAKRIKKNY